MILTRQGRIILSHVFGGSMIISGKDIKLFGEHHLKNIDLLDENFVIDVDEYIGKGAEKNKVFNQ